MGSFSKEVFFAQNGHQKNPASVTVVASATASAGPGSSTAEAVAAVVVVVAAVAAVVVVVAAVAVVVFGGGVPGFFLSNGGFRPLLKHAVVRIIKLIEP